MYKASVRELLKAISPQNMVLYEYGTVPPF
jgi:hypothetical protein